MIVEEAEFSRLGQQMDYEQSKADQARAEQFGYAERGMDAIAGLGSIGLAMGRGLSKPKSQPQTQDSDVDLSKYTGDEWENWDMTNANSQTPPASLVSQASKSLAPKVDPTKPTGYTGPQYGKVSTDQMYQMQKLGSSDMGKNMSDAELYLSIGLDPRAYGVVPPSTLYSPQYMDELESNYFYSPLGGGAGQIETDTP